MIQATGNNFGCGPIQIKDCLDGDMLILNTVITFSPESDEYKAADVLEIYVPDLPLKRSAENGVFLTSYQIKSPGHWDESKRYIATVVRSWIKDKNTICIEKLPIYDELEEIKIYIYQMYTSLGRKGAPVPFVKADFDVTTEQTSINPRDPLLILDDRWLYVHFYLNDPYGIEESVPVVLNLEGFPTDIDITIPMIGGQNLSDYPGCHFCEAHISNAVFTIEEPSIFMRSSSERPFISLYIIRD